MPRFLCVFFLCLSCSRAAADTEAARWNPWSLYRQTRELRAELNGLREKLQTLPDAKVVSQNHGRIGFHGREGKPAWLELDFGEAASPRQIVLFPARVSDPAPGDVESGFPPEVVCYLGHESGRPGQLIAHWRESVPGEGVRLPYLSLPVENHAGRYLRIEVPGFRQSQSRRYYSLGEIVALKDGRNLALGKPVVSSAAILNPPRWTTENLTDGLLWCGQLTGTEPSPANGYHSLIAAQPTDVPKWVEVDLQQSHPIDEIRLIPARPRDYADITGFGFPPSFRVLAYADDADDAAQVIWQSPPGGFANPGDSMVCLPAHGVTARRVRIEATSLWARSGDYIFALAELEVHAGGKNLALDKPVRSLDHVAQARHWTEAALTDGFSSQRRLLNWTDWLSIMDQRQQLERQILQLDAKLQSSRDLLQTSLLRAAALLVGAAIALTGGGFLWQRRRLRLAQSEIRQRLARDFHDEVGSRLSHLALLAELAKKDSSSSERLQQHLATLADDARETLDSMRDLVWLFEPQPDGWKTLHQRIGQSVRRILEPAVADVEIEIAEPPAALPPPPLDWARDLLLFAKEAATNTARHSRARRVVFRLQWQPAALELTLEDNGTGFDESAPGFQPGAGLRSLRARAARLRGALDITSRPGHGVRLRLIIPLP